MLCGYKICIVLCITAYIAAGGGEDIADVSSSTDTIENTDDFATSKQEIIPNEVVTFLSEIYGFEETMFEGKFEEELLSITQLDFETTKIFFSHLQENNDNRTEVIEIFNDEIKKYPNLDQLKNKLDKTVKIELSKNSTQPARPYNCQPLNVSSLNESQVVVLSNETAMEDMLIQLNLTKACAIVLFYSSHCHFCTGIAPLYNAVGRTFPNLGVFAIDAQAAVSLSARYGIIGIPTLLLFSGGKAMVKFNGSRNVEDMERFIKEYTGFLPSSQFNITEVDFNGPLPSTLLGSPDHFLIFSVCFLILFFVWVLFGNYITKTGADLLVSIESWYTGHQKTD